MRRGAEQARALLPTTVRAWLLLPVMPPSLALLAIPTVDRRPSVVIG
jgi:hypothetical protein